MAPEERQDWFGTGAGGINHNALGSADGRIFVAVSGESRKPSTSAYCLACRCVEDGSGKFA